MGCVHSILNDELPRSCRKIIIFRNIKVISILNISGMLYLFFFFIKPSRMAFYSVWRRGSERSTNIHKILWFAALKCKCAHKWIFKWKENSRWNYNFNIYNYAVIVLYTLPIHVPYECGDAFYEAHRRFNEQTEWCCYASMHDSVLDQFIAVSLVVCNSMCTWNNLSVSTTRSTLHHSQHGFINELNELLSTSPHHHHHFRHIYIYIYVYANVLIHTYINRSHSVIRLSVEPVEPAPRPRQHISAFS